MRMGTVWYPSGFRADEGARSGTDGLENVEDQSLPGSSTATHSMWEQTGGLSETKKHKARPSKEIGEDEPDDGAR